MAAPIYDRCKLILAEAEAADGLAADHLLEPRGKLRVAVPVLFGRHGVAPVLLGLASRHPALEIEVSFNDRLVDLNEAGFDLAVRTGKVHAAEGIIARFLGSQQMIVCAAPSYIAERGQPVGLADLGMRYTIANGGSARTSPWLFPRADGSAPEEFIPSSRLRFDDMEAIADAAVAGMGLAWLPSWLVRARLRSGALVRLLADQPPYLYDCHALWAQTPHVPRKVRLVIDALVSALPALMQ